MFDSESETAAQTLLNQFHDFKIPPNSYIFTASAPWKIPTAAWSKRVGRGEVPDNVVHARSIRALPEWV